MPRSHQRQAFPMCALSPACPACATRSQRCQTAVMHSAAEQLHRCACIVLACLLSPANGYLSFSRLLVCSISDPVQPAQSHMYWLLCHYECIPRELVLLQRHVIMLH